MGTGTCLHCTSQQFILLPWVLWILSQPGQIQTNDVCSRAGIPIRSAESSLSTTSTPGRSSVSRYSASNIRVRGFVNILPATNTRVTPPVNNIWATCTEYQKHERGNCTCPGCGKFAFPKQRQVLYQQSSTPCDRRRCTRVIGSVRASFPAMLVRSLFRPALMTSLGQLVGQ